MIEIQCTSCNTRYRIDERVLPDETPTFKCSRCGHVFTAEPVGPERRKPAAATRLQSVARRTPRADAKAEQSESRSESAPAAEEPEPAPPDAALAEPPPSGLLRPETASEKPAEAPARGDPLDRPFEREPAREEPAANLSFDFSEDGDPDESLDEGGADAAPQAEKEWEVGEPPEEFETPPVVAPPAPPAPPRTVRAPQPVRKSPHFAGPHSERIAQEFEQTSRPARPAADREEAAAEIPDELADLAQRASVHNSGWFIGAFFAVAVGFAAAGVVICGAPRASARVLSALPGVGERFAQPIVPATEVALRDVHAAYQTIKGGQRALVVTATAENVGAQPLHEVLIVVDLLDSHQRQVAAQAAWCGNNLSARMIGEMTPREIEFLERLDPQKNFVIETSHTAPFVIAFINPPADVARLRIAVAKAAPPGSAPAI
jgi:predicted Zn finger-like uncharacterized protein